jgi:hypothetical protein
MNCCWSIDSSSRSYYCNGDGDGVPRNRPKRADDSYRERGRGMSITRRTGGFFFAKSRGGTAAFEDRADRTGLGDMS